MSGDNELGRFLRDRRERLTPADVGLPQSGRRRTPGLRREEVSALAGVSMDYLVRLEQGRERHPSSAVVAALGNALRLDEDEFRHFSKLTVCAVAPELCPRGQGTADGVPQGIRHILERLHPTPAVVLGPWHQVLAFNNAWERVMAPTGALDEHEPNLVRFVFTDPRARRLFPQWHEAANEHVAVLRAATVRWRDDPRMHALIDELLTVPAFAERWKAQNVLRHRRGSQRICHPVAGELSIDYEVLLAADESDLRVISWLPADEATAATIDQLVLGTDESRRQNLRVVNG